MAGSDTDEKLEKNIGVFLCPVLLKLGSANEEVRAKVINPLLLTLSYT